MGWLPQETMSCTAFEFWAAWDFWVRANNPKPQSEPMTHSELDAIRREYGI